MEEDEIVYLKCPRCGEHEDVHGFDTLEAVAYMDGFLRDKDGKLQPNWSGDTEVQWDSQTPVDKTHPYYCTACDILLRRYGNSLIEKGQ